MLCQLKGSEKYCETGHGTCCQSCMECGTCDKVCLNDPERCRYAVASVPIRCVPAQKSRKGGHHADSTEKM